MAHVSGIGGVFIYSNDPKALAEWYTNHFGIEFEADKKEENFWMLFHSRDDNEPSKRTNTVFAIMPAKTPLGPRRGEYMINYKVDDLQGFIEQLKTKGVNAEPVEDDGHIGKFTWITDPEGNRIELYQPY
ncbi:MAG: VOC family protein [Ktedonobacteraceae bacterium]|nr:VOC family protein [Chloroflexota bacterium]